MMPEHFKELFHQHDWASSSLGPRQDWPVQLASAVDLMLDSAHPTFVLWGSDHIYLFNEAYAELLGGATPDALGASLPELWPHVWEILHPILSQSQSGHGNIAEDVPFKTSASGFKDTGYFTFSSTPIRGPDRQILGSTTLVVDTTEKVKSTKRLARERDAIFRLFQEAPGFIVLVEGPEHRFVFANPSYLRLVCQEDVIGRTVAEVLPEMGRQGFLDVLDQVFTSGERFVAHRLPVEFEQKEPGITEWRHLNFVFEPMRSEVGAIVGIFAQGQDVTEEVKAQHEAHLLRAELVHMARVSAMGSMAATLAHELNQPLTAISNYSTGSQRILRSGGDTDALMTALEQISINSHRAAKIIQSVRTMTKKGEVRRELFALDALIRQTGELARMGACEGVQLEFGLTGDEQVSGDPVQIQQVLLNLIRNACEAVSPAEKKKVTVTSGRYEGKALICVEDSGPGIPPENLSSLFDAFFSTKSEGMGIGLSISRTIIEAHQGDLWAENRSEGGARFCITLPIEDRSGDTQEHRAA